MTNSIFDVPVRRFFVTISGIQWDTSTEDEFDKTSNLPNALEAVVEVEQPGDFTEDELKSEVVPEILSDMITEEYGFCHYGYDIDSIEDYNGDMTQCIVEDFD